MTPEAHERSEAPLPALALDKGETAAVDARYLELCCPTLSEARRALQVRVRVYQVCGNLCRLICVPQR